MFFTLETFQWFRSLLREIAPSNMLCIVVTLLKSGASAAWMFRFAAYVKAYSMDSHLISPHCSIESSLCWYGLPVENDTEYIRGKVPRISTRYVPGMGTETLTEPVSPVSIPFAPGSSTDSQ